MNTTVVPRRTWNGKWNRRRRAQQAWADTPVRQRLRPVTALRACWWRGRRTSAAPIAADVGKSDAEVIGGELLPVADACRFLERGGRAAARGGCRDGRGRAGCSARPTRCSAGRAAAGGDHRHLELPATAQRHPDRAGVTAGNAVVWKPSELTPTFAPMLSNVLLEAIIRRRWCRRCRRHGRRGRRWRWRRRRSIASSSPARRRSVGGWRRGERLISSTLELSGCDLQLVLEDADVDLAARRRGSATP
ncbi:MAG: hypothetical protein U0736_02050 [Gemmataceae bacterium]